MSYRIQTLTSRDGYELSLRFYEADAPKAVVKFIHGMEEYQDRYESFAEYLREAGYTVVTADLRGHGKNAPVLSHIADKEGHLRLLEDEEVILDEIQDPEVNVFPSVLVENLMPHSVQRHDLKIPESGPAQPVF